MDPYLKARLFPAPDPLAAIMRLTMLPPPPAGGALAVQVPAAPASDAAIAQTAVPTVRPGRLS